MPTLEPKRTECPSLDLTRRIAADLGSLRRTRVRRFLPAQATVVAVVGTGMLAIGVRPDLLDQPAWQLALQCVLWVLGLVVFPAIGLGLLFPSRAVRIGLVSGAVAVTGLATFGLPSPAMIEPDIHAGLGCGVLVETYASVVLLLGLLGGAFVQRRKPSAVYWIAAGVALTGLTAITWQCPNTGVAHVLPSHVGAAAIALLATSFVGALAHRRSVRAREAAGCGGCDVGRE